MASRQFNGRVRTPHNEPVLMVVYFTIDGASAVGTQNTGSLAYCTVTKPARTGLYRFTLADAYLDSLIVIPEILAAAGTLDRDIMPVAETNFGTSTPAVVDVQVRKTSDGSAVDPVSITVKCLFVFRNSQVTP